MKALFFALVMSIENFGVLSAAWGGGLLLHTFRVTRTEFGNLWMTILIRSILRLLPLSLLFLVPKSNQNDTILPPEMLVQSGTIDLNEKDIELASLIKVTK